MSLIDSPPGRVSPIATSLAAGRLGVPAVIFFVWAAATPLTVVAGVVTTGYATGLAGIPVAFVSVGMLLAVFSVGYVEMSRHVANAGGLYAFVARGLGRPAGVGAAWVALISYNALQLGLYGVAGAAAAPLLDAWFGIHLAWWMIAVASWAITATLGLLRVDLNGKLLAVLLLAEVGLIAVFSAADLLHPAGGVISVATLAPGSLVGNGVGAALNLAVLGFVGFETTVVLSEEVKDRHRTVRVATYLSIALITGFYAVSSWAMSVAVGPDRIVAVAQTDGTELIFNLAGEHLGPTAVNVGHGLFVTSVLAAMISFHQTVTRYMFALGREHVLPAWLGRTSRRTGSPRNASLVQSALGLVVITGYAVNGWDPVVHLFYWLGTTGGLGVLLLLAATAIAIVDYFAHNPSKGHGWRTWLPSCAAAVGLVAVAGLAVSNVAPLLGVAADHPLTWIVPTAFLTAAILGAAWGLLLKHTRPEVYATIGLGPKSATARLHQAVPPPRLPAYEGDVVGREAHR